MHEILASGQRISAHLYGKPTAGQVVGVGKCAKQFRILICSREYPRQFHKTSKLAISATGMAIMPILKNSQAVISTFSRRRAMSQRIVASEPVTERLGPRSTPIRIACATTVVSCACRIAAPLIRPTGKLFIPFESNATTRAAVPLATQRVVSASARSPVSPKRRRPAFCNASTMTKRPATNGSTDQDTPFATLSGMLRSRHATKAIAQTAAKQVGAPSESPRAEDETSAAAAMASPTKASFPSVESNTRVTSPCISPLSSLRESHLKHRNVSTMEAPEGSRKMCNHIPSGGMCCPKTTRLAGLEIGKTKLAAFAMNAQASKYGLGLTLALRTTARTAGVSTTAVASFQT